MTTTATTNTPTTDTPPRPKMTLKEWRAIDKDYRGIDKDGDYSMLDCVNGATMMVKVEIIK